MHVRVWRILMPPGSSCVAVLVPFGAFESSADRPRGIRGGVGGYGRNRRADRQVIDCSSLASHSRSYSCTVLCALLECYPIGLPINGACGSSGRHVVRALGLKRPLDAWSTQVQKG